ncbi:MAG TPA: CHAD domain-containing protein [Coriobacteriia bacterium]
MDNRFAVTGVDAFTPLVEAAPALLLAKAEPLFALEGAASSGADIDAVHDMRVASRRLRETMRLLEPLYPQREFRDWYKRVRGITRALGPVRDADVFIAEFAGLGKSLGEGGRRAVAFLIGRRMGAREHELVTLNRQLAHLDLAESRRTLRKLARTVRSSPDEGRTLAGFAHAAVAERAGVVFGALPGALPEDNVAQQHALRIDFKQLRYAVEVFAPVYGEEFDDLHDTLTAFQDTLGDLHDLHLFLDLLREPELAETAARAGVSAEDLGEVITLLEQRAKQTFDAFSALAAQHPASELLPALLLPLSRVPEPPRAEEAPATPEPVAAPAPSAAVVLEEPAVVPPDSMPAIDPSAQPWRSDAAGLAIDPPIVVGAEPWARPTLESAGAPPGEPAPSAPSLEEHR